MSERRSGVEGIDFLFYRRMGGDAVREVIEGGTGGGLKN